MNQFGDGIAGIHGRGPEGFVVPDVLANGDAELLLEKAVDILFVAGLEVAGFIEDVVGGEKHFGLLEDHTAFVDERGFIGNELPCPMMIRIDAPGVTNDGGERHLRGDAIERVMIALDEGGAFEKIEGKVAADAKLGKDGEVGA